MFILDILQKMMLQIENERQNTGYFKFQKAKWFLFSFLGINAEEDIHYKSGLFPEWWPLVLGSLGCSTFQALCLQLRRRQTQTLPS